MDKEDLAKFSTYQEDTDIQIPRLLDLYDSVEPSADVLGNFH